MRYFTYRYSGTKQQRGKSGRLYWFAYGYVTEVPIEEDAEWFLHMGTPENGMYQYRETDAAGNPIGAFPPINLDLRQAAIDPKTFPSDKSPSAPEWKLMTETMADPVLYYHHIREKRR